MRLAICIPCYGAMAIDTARSLAMLLFAIAQNPPEGLEWIGIETQGSSNLPELRHNLAVNALMQHKATHILWIDADQVFPMESFHRLLAHDKEIVGANYPRRNPPHISAACDVDGQPFKASATGLEQASTIGFGLLLTRACVFEGEHDMPLFAHHDEHGYITEDVSFCRKVRARGHEVWVDHDLSREVRHIGLISLGFEHMEQAQ